MSQLIAARRGRPGYDQRAVLDIAVAAFIEFGYDATSMGVLAERLGLSKSAIYHHFASKDEILRRALDEALDGLEGVLDDADASAARGPGDGDGGAGDGGGGPAVDRLEQVLRGAVAVLVDRLAYVTLLLRVRGNSDIERAALARRRAFDRRVTALVAAAQHEGSVRRDIDASVVERLLFGMINSIVEWYRPGGREDAARLADDVVAVALDGLRVR